MPPSPVLSDFWNWSHAPLRFHGYFPENCHGHRALFLFRYQGQFLQTLSLTVLLKKTTHCTITGRHGYFPNFQRYLLDFISKSVISSSPGIASGKNTDAMWCAVNFLIFIHSWGVYSVFSNFSLSTRLKVTSFLGFPQSIGKEVTRF